MLIARAPVRISFAGGGTDLPVFFEKHGGAVVSATIDKYVYVILTVHGGPELQILSSDYRTFYRHTPGQALFWEGGLNLPKAILHELSPGYYDLVATTPRVAHRNFVPLIVVDSARLSGLDGVLKALLDYGLGLLLFILTLPLSLTIALGLRLGGAGPVFVAQEFVGIGGRTFRGRTFRAAPEHGLRVTGLHRLPLLGPALLGQMSLVGPRPISAEVRERYRRWLPSLVSVKPGMTGPWAVVPVASLEEEMRAALYYIRNWTIWLDLQILTQTVLVILRRRWGKLE